jgi:hypothetical protein
MAKVATKNQRTIRQEIMKSVMEYAPQDGFKLEDDMLNKVYTVTGVRETTFGKDQKSFIATLEAEDGKVINMSAGLFKRARVLSKSDAKVGKAYGTAKNCYPRSQSEDIWNSSIYFHTAGEGMKQDDEFILPSQLKIKCAVLSEDSDKNPILQPNLYKGYRTVVSHYQKNGTFPTFDDFKAELQKVEDRIPGLPLNLTTPTLNDWVKEGEVGNFRSTLIFQDVVV